MTAMNVALSVLLAMKLKAGLTYTQFRIATKRPVVRAQNLPLN